jgi:lipoprotein-anchoring transpeptidase ErfK/SrfK
VRYNTSFSAKMLHTDTACATTQSSVPKKPFRPRDANLLKQPLATPPSNEAPNGRSVTGAQMEIPMITLASFERNIRRTATAIGALVIGALSFSNSATAAPLPLFPFFMAPPVQSEPAPMMQAPQADDDNAVVEQPARFKRQIVSYMTREVPGTIIIDTPNTYLYYVLGNGQAIRYGIGVGRDGFTWSGVQTVTRKAEWPAWTPPAEMIARQPYLPRHMAGGPGNPLGARAMYLGGTVYRIHGTNMPETIGTQVSSGCIRLTNQDVSDLYSRVSVGTKVVVLPMIDRRADGARARQG